MTHLQRKLKKKMFITINKVFKKIKDLIWGTKKVNNNKEEESSIDNRVIMLNRAKRRHLAAKLRKSNYNNRSYKNIKACQLPHSVPVNELYGICMVAGIDPQELRDVN